MTLQFLRNVQETYTAAGDRCCSNFCPRKCYPPRLRVLCQDAIFTLIKYTVLLVIWAYIIFKTENPSEVAYLEHFTNLVDNSKSLLPNITMTGFQMNYNEEVFIVDVNGSGPNQLASVLGSFDVSVLSIPAVAQMVGVDPHNLTRAKAEQFVGANWICTDLDGGSRGQFFHPKYPKVHFTWPGGSLFFTMTVFTTIGYGTYAPETKHGKLLMIPMAIFGLWVTAAAISSFLTLFQYVTDRIVAIHPRVCGRFGKVLCTTAAMLLMLYLLIEGLKWFEEWEEWESFYFAWITMTTIGFGDYVPETKWGQNLTMLLAIMFVGLFPFWIQTCMDCVQDLCHRNTKAELPGYEVTLKYTVTELNYHGHEGWVWVTTVDGEQFCVNQSCIVQAPDELLVGMDPRMDISKAEDIITAGYKHNVQLSSERIVNM